MDKLKIEVETKIKLAPEHFEITFSANTPPHIITKIVKVLNDDNAHVGVELMKYQKEKKKKKLLLESED